MITITAKITLEDGTQIDINKRNALSIEQTIVDRSDINLPSAGIISNGGYIEFVDYDGKVKRLAESYKLNNKAIAIIFINDTLNKTHSQLGEYYATKWNYDSANRAVKVSLSDNLIEWQDLEINLMRMQPIMSALDLYEFLKNKTPSKWIFAELDDDTRNVLRTYTIAFPYLEKGKLWQQWSKLCDACGLHIFKNTKNEVVVSYDFRS